MEDIWPSRDGISETSACVKFGGSADIQTDVTILAHTHTDWVGPQATSWADEDEVCEVNSIESKTSVTHAAHRVVVIDTYRQRVLQEQHKYNHITVACVAKEESDRSVSFDNTVLYVEPYSLHAFRFLGSFCRASVDSNSCGVVSASHFSVSGESANDDQRPQRTCARLHATRTDHFDAAREGETLNLSYIPPSVRSHVLPAYDSCLSVIVSSCASHSVRCTCARCSLSSTGRLAQAIYAPTSFVVRPVLSDR